MEVLKGQHLEERRTSHLRTVDEKEVVLKKIERTEHMDEYQATIPAKCRSCDFGQTHRFDPITLTSRRLY